MPSPPPDWHNHHVLVLSKSVEKILAEDEQLKKHDCYHCWDHPSGEELDGPDVFTKLDNDGDAVIHLGAKSFLVCTKTLGLASRVFKLFFDARFADGLVLQSGGVPELNLDEYDPQAMEALLRILHFRSLSDPGLLPSADYAPLIIFADKYGCLEPLQWHMQKWLEDLERLASPESGELPFYFFPETCGWVLLALVVLKSEHLPGMAVKVAKQLSSTNCWIGIWTKLTVLKFIPDELIEQMLEFSWQTKNAMFDTVAATEEGFKQKAGYMKLWETCDTWLASFLIGHELTTSSEWEDCSVLDFQERFKEAKAEVHKYECPCLNKGDCPLRKEMSRMTTEVDRILKTAENNTAAIIQASKGDLYPATEEGNNVGPSTRDNFW